MPGCCTNFTRSVFTPLVTVLVLLATFSASAQCPCITGTIHDQHDSIPLPNAVIALINDKDSTLNSFTRADTKGHFSLKTPADGKFQLLITYPGYADFVDHIAGSKNNSSKLGMITMIKKSELLEEVIVKQKLAAIRVKGDTIEYSADSFKVRQGATVSELLKQLPGMQVDRNGNITAQGQKVNKVLVDGEEFFSDDPAVVTENLAADYVKDVQVFDKKSEQADFTGIDDGKKSRTINLKLKADKKKGYFGKVTASGGSHGSFDNSAMVNSFKGKRKLSAFGIMSNTNHTNLDWDERSKYGASEGPEYDADNGYFMYSGSIDDEFSQDLNSDEGLPTTWTAGLHYSDNWRDINKLGADYRFMKRNLVSSSSTISQYILPDTQYFNAQSHTGFSSRNKNSLSGRYDLKFDSSSSIRINLSGSRTNSHGESFSTSRALNSDSGLVNDNSRTMSSDMSKNNFVADLLWRKKLKKKGRTISVSFRDAVSDESLDGLLQSNTDFYVANTLTRTEKIDQKKINSGNSNGLNTSLTYTEPLAKDFFLSLNYNFSLNRNSTHRSSFNKDEQDQDYKMRDSLFSNDFKYNYSTNAAGAYFRYNHKKINFNIGSLVSQSAYTQRDLVSDTMSHYVLNNLAPQASVSWKLGPQKNFGLYYNGQTHSPTPQQIQPVRQNDDPLNISIGNPDLRQEFNHNFSLNYSDYKVLTDRYIWIYAYGTITSNAISMSSVVDNGGKSTNQYVNTRPNFSQNFSFDYGIKSAGLDLRLGTGLTYGFSRINSFVNGLSNVNNNQNVRLNLSAGKYVEKKFAFSLRPYIEYTHSKSTLRPDVTTSYFALGGYADGSVEFPGKIRLGSSVDVSVRQKTNVFDVNRNVILWNADLSKKFGKANRAEFAILINDILNQNIGFNRSATSNFITQHTYTTLRRYGMLRFVYNISKTP